MIRYFLIFVAVLSSPSWMIFPSSLMWTLVVLSLSQSITRLMVRFILSPMHCLVISIVILKILILPLNMKIMTSPDSLNPSPILNASVPLLLSVALSMILVICSISCASPKSSVRVRNNATGSETTISIRNGEGSSTSVSVSPSMQVDSLKFDFLKNGNR